MVQASGFGLAWLDPGFGFGFGLRFTKPKPDEAMVSGPSQARTNYCRDPSIATAQKSRF
jgi:hypothetical protein